MRATVPGEGPAIAALWRELWDVQEAFGGYPGSRDPAVYTNLARLLDEDARARAGHPVRGHHVHLVADIGGVPCGQVQGWFDRHGVEPTTPFTCEVRSLIVAERARGFGAGRVLLQALTATAKILSNGMPYVLAAEVLEPNPAVSFYERIGYVTVGHSARMDPAQSASSRDAFATSPVARVALPQDALSIAQLDRVLAARRRAMADVRFDPPRLIDATTVDGIATQLLAHAGDEPPNPAVLVSVDADGVVVGAALFIVQELEPPFVPGLRALLGHFAVSPACATTPVVLSLVALACRLSLLRGASQMAIADLSAPGTELHEAALALGATPWSRLMIQACAG